MENVAIVRLGPQHAGAIVACFESVYGGSYANELFCDVALLTDAIASAELRCVGAIDPEGTLLGHMAMTTLARARCAELGNTAVVPEARGSGLAWRVGDALVGWCRELGHTAYVHYPTTDHHIMQRRSVQRGFETGLMLGYIPEETDGQVTARARSLRGAATIVYQPIVDETQPAAPAFLPRQYQAVCRDLANACGLTRQWREAPTTDRPQRSRATIDVLAKRNVRRLDTEWVGSDFRGWVEDLLVEDAACWQIDLSLDDAAINDAVDVVTSFGFVFCGWLPTFSASDVLRMQRVDEPVTDLAPNVINPVAKTLLGLIQREQESMVRR